MSEPVNERGIDLDRDVIQLPVHLLPSYRNKEAMERGKTKRWLFGAYGGLGDVVCCEPTVRYMLQKFPAADLTVLTEYPEVFSHLKVKTLGFSSEIDLREYRFFESGLKEGLLWEFVQPGAIPTVDLISISALQRPLPPGDRQIVLSKSKSDHPLFKDFLRSPQRFIFLHPGRTWPSRTIPETWWKPFAEKLSETWVPIVIGRNSSDGENGVLDFSLPDRAIDLRNDPEFQLKDLISFLSHADKVFTNDSAPLHIAAGDGARIGFISSARPGWHLMHYRAGKLGWNQWDFAQTCLQDELDWNPLNPFALNYDQVPDDQFWSRVLPDPEQLAERLFDIWRLPAYAES